MLPLLTVIAACSQQPLLEEGVARPRLGMPTDFSGSWERNYARDDELNAALRAAYDRLVRSMPDQRVPRGPNITVGPSSKDWDKLVALARLAELITRPDVLTIIQDDFEIRVDRKDDFSLLCAFFDGASKGTMTAFGTEICGWDGDQLVSRLILPDGLQITHRFTISADRRQLRVVTTVASNTSRVPFTLRRFYTKFKRPAPAFNCVETFSMKRVCSTGELRL